MDLPPHQKRILEWFADPTKSRKNADIAAALGFTVHTVTHARHMLKKLGLIQTVVTPAGKDLLSQ